MKHAARSLTAFAAAALACTGTTAQPAHAGLLSALGFVGDPSVMAQFTPVCSLRDRNVAVYQQNGTANTFEVYLGSNRGAETWARVYSRVQDDSESFWASYGKQGNRVLIGPNSAFGVTPDRHASIHPGPLGGTVTVVPPIEFAQTIAGVAQTAIYDLYFQGIRPGFACNPDALHY